MSKDAEYEKAMATWEKIKGDCIFHCSKLPRSEGSGYYVEDRGFHSAEAEAAWNSDIADCEKAVERIYEEVAEDYADEGDPRY